MASLGEISVSLLADTSKFEAGIKRASSLSSGAAKELKTLGGVAAGIGVALAAVGLTAGKLVKDLTAAGDAAAKAASRMGTTAEAVQELGYAAELSGSNVQDVEKSFQRLSKNANDAAQGIGTGKVAFDRLGISVKDANGNLKSSEQLFSESADALSKLGSDTERAALAQDIFGKSGAKLIPMLKTGAVGIANMREEARSLGLVISNDTAAASELFNDNMQRLNSTFEGIKRTIGAALLPSFIEVQNVLQGLTKEFGGTDDATTVVKEGIKGFADALVTISPLLTVVTGAVGGLIDFFNTLRIASNTLAIGVGGIVEGFYAMQVALDGNAENTKRLADHQYRLGLLVNETRGHIDEWGDATMTGVEVGGKLRKVTDDVAAAMKRGAEGTDEFTRKLQEQKKKTEDLIPPLDELTVILNGGKPAAFGFGDGIDKIGKSSETAAQQLQGFVDELFRLRDASKAVGDIGQGALDDINAAQYAGASGVGTGVGAGLTPLNSNAGPGSGPMGDGSELATSAGAMAGVGVAAAAATGGMSALASAVGDAITKTKGYADVQDQVGRLLSVVVEPVGRQLESLATILKPVVSLLDALWPIIEVMNTVMNPMVLILKPLALAFDALNKPIQSLKWAVEDIVEWFSNIIPDWAKKKPGNTSDVTPEEIARQFGYKDPTAELAGGGMVEDYVIPAVSSLGSFTDALKEATASLSNVPTIFRTAMRRGQASEGLSADRSGWAGAIGGQTGASALAGMGGGTYIAGDVYVNSDTPKTFGEALARNAFVKTGSRGASEATNLVFGLASAG